MNYDNTYDKRRAYDLSCMIDTHTNDISFKRKNVDTSELQLEELSCGPVKFSLYYFPW